MPIGLLFCKRLIFPSLPNLLDKNVSSSIMKSLLTRVLFRKAKRYLCSLRASSRARGLGFRWGEKVEGGRASENFSKYLVSLIVLRPEKLQAVKIFCYRGFDLSVVCPLQGIIDEQMQKYGKICGFDGRRVGWRVEIGQI